MIKRIRYYLNALLSVKYRVDDLSRQINELGESHSKDLKSIQINLGNIQSRLNNQIGSIDDLSEVEFRVFSQFGDDGIIQYLINKVSITNKTFIEFGVENYRESNTRFLLFNNNWTGFVIDGSKENVDFINNDIQNWTSELSAEAAFINADNINSLLRKARFATEVGLLSIDIDGNDYWVWRAIDCISPIIVVIEYNSLFGKNNAWTIPYDPTFIRGKMHFSKLYFGASLKALQILSQQKGYSLIGSCSRGLNAYFIRNDKVGNLKVKSAEECYVLSKFREEVKDGKRISGIDRIKQIEGLDVLDITTGETVKIDSSLIKF